MSVPLVSNSTHDRFIVGESRGAEAFIGYLYEYRAMREAIDASMQIQSREALNRAWGPIDIEWLHGCCH